MPTLYGVNVSPFVRKVRIVAAEKKVDYDMKPVYPGGGGYEEYEKLHPLKKIPTWQDGDLVLPDSSAICAWLEKTHASPALYPGDARDYARAIWFEAFGDEGLVKPTGSIFFERIVAKLLFQREGDEEVVRKAMAETMPPLLDYLESQLGEGDWLVGGKFSIADIGTATHFVNLAHAGVSPDASRWPKTAAWATRFAERPTVAPLIAQERKELGRS